jgi:hypothetical protein
MTSLASQLAQIANPDIITSDVRSITQSIELSADASDQVVADSLRLCADINSLASAMNEAEDEGELYRSLAALWLELRFEWQRHNLVANYETIRTGDCPPVVMVRASAASYVLQRIETLLAREHLDKLGDSAVDLLDVLREDVDRTRSSVG